MSRGNSKGNSGTEAEVDTSSAGDETTIDSETREAAPTAFAEEPTTSELAAAGAQAAKDDEGVQNPLRGGGDDETDPTPSSREVDVEIGDKTFTVDVNEQTQLNALPVRLTATDAQGIERVIVPTRDPWTPNAVDPDPEEVARLERRQEALEAKRAEGLKALGVDA